MTEQSWTHGTPAGWQHGCWGAGCINHGTDLDTCARAWIRYAGDYGYRKHVDAGWTPQQLHDADIFDAAAALTAEREARQASRAATTVPPRKVTTRVPQPPRERAQREPKLRVVKERPSPKVPEHGTVEGYRAGCFKASMCTASPTCEEANLIRLGLLAEKKQRYDSTRPKQSEIPAEHGTLTMHRRGCRGEECPASPSCAEVAHAFYAERNRTMVRNVKGHGTNASWARGCHCTDCYEAHKEYHRQYWRTRRESIPAENHGTPYGYGLGCRDRGSCPGGADGVTCADASLAEERRRRREAGVRALELVDAKPVIEHIQELRRTGIGAVKIAKLAGVGHTSVSTLIYGRTGARKGQIPSKVTAENAAKILAVTV